MSGAEAGLFPVAEGERSTGLWPAQMLRGAVMLGHEIIAAVPLEPDQIQPASIDLRLGEVAYRVRASFLPGGRDSVRDKLERLSMRCWRRTASTSCRCSSTWR